MQEVAAREVRASGGGRTGYLVEYTATKDLFEDPKEEYTKQYIRAEFSWSRVRPWRWSEILLLVSNPTW
jgi:ABC-type microcin C transport system duplicated ATPase subunit YejF